ncbi:hypothetical protein AD998_12355 [bacterium 336/3]|nr:hypothetical protein AD998_12355 [bacterium 336/3]
MQNKKLFFMIIDDDKLNNIICQTIIAKNYPQSTYLSFIDPNEALEYLQNTVNKQPDVIFLDIHMPYVDGWKFLENFKKLEISRKAYIVIISSSINERDIRKASEHPLVKAYIEKPIVIDKINQTLKDLLE